MYTRVQKALQAPQVNEDSHHFVFLLGMWHIHPGKRQTYANKKHKLFGKKPFPYKFLKSPNSVKHSDSPANFCWLSWLQRKFWFPCMAGHENISGKSTTPVKVDVCLCQDSMLFGQTKVVLFAPFSCSSNLGVFVGQFAFQNSETMWL